MSNLKRNKSLCEGRSRPFRVLAFAALLGASGVASAQQAPEAITLIGRGSAGSTSDLAFVVMEEAIKRSFPGQAIQIRRLPGTASAVP